MATYNLRKPAASEDAPLVAIYVWRTSPELKAALEEKAQAEGLELNRYMSRLLANAIDRPDLVAVPHRKRGPKPGFKALAAKR